MERTKRAAAEKVENWAVFSKTGAMASNEDKPGNKDGRNRGGAEDNKGREGQITKERIAQTVHAVAQSTIQATLQDNHDHDQAQNPSYCPGEDPDILQANMAILQKIKEMQARNQAMQQELLTERLMAQLEEQKRQEEQLELGMRAIRHNSKLAEEKHMGAMKNLQSQMQQAQRDVFSKPGDPQFMEQWDKVDKWLDKYLGVDTGACALNIDVNKPTGERSPADGVNITNTVSGGGGGGQVGMANQRPG